MVKTKVKPLQIADALGLHLDTVYKLRREFNKKGEKAFLALKKRGSHMPKSYAPRGKRPVVRSTWARLGINSIASVTNKGSLSFSIYTTTVTSEVFIKVLERLVKKENGKPLIVIVDGHPVHKSRAVKDWVDKKNGLLKRVILPA